jgi:hypothetical protein
LDQSASAAGSLRVISIPHRVDPVHDKVQNDLLKLNVVAEDRQRILCGHTNQFTISKPLACNSSTMAIVKYADSFPLGCEQF